MNPNSKVSIMSFLLALLLVVGLATSASCQEASVSLDIPLAAGEQKIEQMQEQLMEYIPKETKPSKYKIKYDKQVELPETHKSGDKKKYKLITLAVPLDFDVERDLDETLLRHKRDARAQPEAEEPQAEAVKPNEDVKPEPVEETAQTEPAKSKDTKVKDKSGSEEKSAQKETKKSSQSKSKVDKKRSKRESKKSSKGDNKAHQKNKELKKTKKGQSQEEKKNN